MPEFQTGVYRMDWLSTGPGQFPYQSGKGRTDADGNFSLPLNDIEVGDTAELTLEITATESGGFPVSARDTLTMHPAKFYAGIRPDAWFGQARLSYLDSETIARHDPSGLAFLNVNTPEELAAAERLGAP